ncbi:hypothetical protein NFI96_001735 [Prochilodus magdalenae]|nr:hypothetical protein NFI96_001735 [Prochilodus magdalenae]
MGKSKEISQDIRKRIVDLHKSGSSLGAISRCLKVPRSSVQTIISKYKKDGNVQPSYRSGRKKVLCPRDERALVRSVRINPRAKAKDLVNMMAEAVRLHHFASYFCHNCVLKYCTCTEQVWSHFLMLTDTKPTSRICMDVEAGIQVQQPGTKGAAKCFQRVVHGVGQVLQHVFELSPHSPVSHHPHWVKMRPQDRVGLLDDSVQSLPVSGGDAAAQAHHSIKDG